MQLWGFALKTGDATPDALNWANIGPGDSPQANADQTIVGISTSITLRATLTSGSYDPGIKSFLVYKNGSSAGSVSPEDNATLDVTVNVGDTVHYEATKGSPGSGTAWNATCTVTNLNTGATLDTFTVNVSAIP